MEAMEKSSGTIYFSFLVIDFLSPYKKLGSVQLAFACGGMG